MEERIHQHYVTLPPPALTFYNGTMTDAQQKEYLKKYEAEVISPEEAAKWTRSASNAGYHYLGCAKTFALMGKHFAEATLQMINGQKR